MSAFVGPQLAENGSTMLIPTLSEDLDLSYQVWDGDTRVPLMLDGSTPSYDITLGSVRLSRDGSMLIGTVTVDGEEKGFVIPDGMNGAPAVWLYGVGETVAADTNGEIIIGSTFGIPVYWNLEGALGSAFDRGGWEGGVASLFSGNGNVIFGTLSTGEDFDLARWSALEAGYELEVLDFPNGMPRPMRRRPWSATSTATPWPVRSAWTRWTRPSTGRARTVFRRSIWMALAARSTIAG
jgi:hypothetical protein